MRRSHFVALTGALAACRSLPARADDASVIRLSAGGVEEFALPYYAVQKGFLRDAGLNVELSVINGGGLVTQAIIGGAIDAGVTNSGSMSAAHVRGLPIYLLSPGGVYSPNSPIAHIVVAKNSPINDAAGLVGKTVGVSTLNDMVQAAGMSWLDRHGVDSRAVKFFEIKSAEMAAAVGIGRLDGAIMVEPGYSAAKDQLKLIGLPYEAVNNGKPFQTAGTIANKTWVEQNPDLARRLTQVLLHTADWANKNPVEVVALLTQLTKIDPVKINSFPRIPFATKNDPGLVQPVIDMIAHYGFIPKPFPAAELRAPGA